MAKDLCPCVGELLASMVAIEAMEHNAVQSNLWRRLGDLLRERSPKLFEEFPYLADEFPLVNAIDEPLAEFGLAAWLSKIQEKCGMATEDLMVKNGAARKLMRANRPWDALRLYTDIKSKLLDRATEFCKE
jgi:hypothetical protein